MKFSQFPKWIICEFAFVALYSQCMYYMLYESSRDRVGYTEPRTDFLAQTCDAGLAKQLVRSRYYSQMFNTSCGPMFKPPSLGPPPLPLTDSGRARRGRSNAPMGRPFTYRESRCVLPTVASPTSTTLYRWSQPRATEYTVWYTML